MSTTPASADATPTELNAADAFGEDESGERDGRHRVEGREDSHDADLTEARGRGEEGVPGRVEGCRSSRSLRGVRERR
jgi:hypothetical protein